MKAFNKIGFHTSVGGNPTGIGDWMKALDAANIPFFIKATDSMTGLFDAQQLIYARNHANEEAVPHTLVFRRSTHNGESYDLPDYDKAPEAAAAEHWQKHKAQLPPELDPKLVWIETINEPRKEVAWADWLGNFAYYTAQMALADGYKYAAFGYSTGTPDEGAWETDGMLRYLELCQDHPDDLAIALHEYSLVVDDIWYLRGYHIGRFRLLYDVCDKYRLERPKTLITEWGWTHTRVPSDPKKAIQDIKEVGELYAKYPELLGAAMWYLGPGFSGIANRTQKLIKPVTDFTLTHTFEGPAPTAMGFAPAPPGPAPLRSAGAAVTASRTNARFIRDVTIPDDTRFPTGHTFTKTWRVENNGGRAWEDGYRLVHVAGVAMTDNTSLPLPTLRPGQQTDISIPMTAPATPGTHFSDWRFHDEAGRPFGDIIFTRIITIPPAPQPAGVSDSHFVADITIPDDMEVAPGTVFTKTWRVRNSGTRAWGPGFFLNFVGGVSLGAAASYPLPTAAPGEEVDISIVMTAPSTPGTYFADWRMQDDQGNPFGQLIYVRIIVPSPAGASLAPPFSQRDPIWADKKLGHAGSPKTIGEWGCLLTCFAMTANTFGQDVTPAQLNDAMVRKGGFLDGYLTKWNALSNVYTDIVFEGKVDPSPALLDRINTSLAAGRPVTVQVDFTSDTPYTDNDQHWVLIVGRDGDDYRINDPWLLPPQETSLRARYGRAGRPFWETIMSAIFYRSTRQSTPETPAPVTPIALKQLQTGMNINPDAPHSNPIDTDDLKGMDWVRFVFKLAARVNPAERGDIQAAFAQYDGIIRKYNQMGVRSLIILNQETVWGNAPWSGNNDWRSYAGQLADVAHQIATRYQRYGDHVAYEIWNEGDLPNNPASVFVPPDQFALVLKQTADAIRAASPLSPLVFGGLATGPDAGIAYLKQCKAALNGPWPVDAIGIHPYGRWATRAPFDWGQNFGTLGDAFARYRAEIGDMAFWITEIGVAADDEISPQHYAEIGNYMKDVYQHVGERFTDLVPVLIWFAWSDWMRNAGIVDKNGQRKDYVYGAFRAVRNREL